MKPKLMIWSGTGLLCLGLAIPMLTILKMLPLSFLLDVLSYAASVTGLLVGVIGVALSVDPFEGK